MNNSSRRNKPRSYIFDVPTNSYIHSPHEDENDFIINKALTSRGTSLKSGSKAISRTNSLNPEESTQDYTDRQLEFNMNFLPYIYAQAGYNKLRSILKSFKHKNSTDSLPINRKPRELDIFAEEEKPANQEFIRVKSMEVSKLNLETALL